MAFIKQDIKERFMRYVEMVPEAGCWLWMSTERRGYGAFWDGAKQASSHRVSYQLFRGSIPSDKMVLHTCDVKLFVNPNHMYLGTPKDNVRDALQRGQKETGDRHWRRRNPDRQRGEENPDHRFTETQVREIRAAALTERKPILAERYGVSLRTIYDVVRRKTWTHI